MNGRRYALVAALCAVGLSAATASRAQDLSTATDLALRSSEMAAQADIDLTVAEAFTPGPAEAPAAAPPAAPAPQPTFRNPFTSPRPSLREAFADMVAAFSAEFRATAPPPRSLSQAAGPEPTFERAADIDFTVADAFDASRLAAPSATSQGVPATARVGPSDDRGAARARSLNLASAEQGREAAKALADHEAAQRAYQAELARWRAELDR